MLQRLLSAPLGAESSRAADRVRSYWPCQARPVQPQAPRRSSGRAPRARRRRVLRTAARTGDSGEDSGDPEPPGVAPGGDLTHISLVLERYLLEVRERTA